MSTEVLKRKIGFDPFITFHEIPHTYNDPDGVEYTPVSTVLHTFCRPFNSASVSYGMTGGDSRAQEELLRQWEHKKNYAADYGTRVHKILEDYFKTGQCPDQYREIVEDIVSYMRPYERVLPEMQFYSVKHKVAGTSDLPFVRRSFKGENGRMVEQLDIGDYKTNTAHGIRTSGTYWSGNKYKHKEYMLGPWSHLEETEYNKYALQLSMYGYMAELVYNVKIGRLFLLNIQLNGRVKPIPIPYMRYEAEIGLDAYSKLQKIA